MIRSQSHLIVLFASQISVGCLAVAAMTFKGLSGS